MDALVADAGTLSQGVPPAVLQDLQGVLSYALALGDVLLDDHVVDALVAVKAQLKLLTLPLSDGHWMAEYPALLVTPLL